FSSPTILSTGNAEKKIWQPQCDLRKIDQQPHHEDHRADEGDDPDKDIQNTTAIFADALNHIEIQAIRRSNERKLHHQDHEDSEPDEIEAQADRQRTHNADRYDHHGYCFKETSQHEVEQNDRPDHYLRGKAQITHPCGHLLRQAEQPQHEIKDE